MWKQYAGCAEPLLALVFDTLTGTGLFGFRDVPLMQGEGCHGLQRMDTGCIKVIVVCLGQTDWKCAEDV